MTRLLVLHPLGTAGWWGRHGYAPVYEAPDDGFVSNVTVPSASNTGSRIAEIDMQTIGMGDLTNFDTPNELVQGKIIYGGARVRANGVTFRDCLFILPDGLSAIRHGAYCWYGASNITFEFCTFLVPESARVWQADTAVHGVGYTINRCSFEGWVDGFMGYGQGSIGDVTVKDSYFGALARYDYDGGQHSDGTHNDQGQLQGRLRDVSITGNNFGTAKSSCLLFTRGSSGTDGYANIEVSDNWFRLEDPLFGSFVNFEKLTVGGVSGAIKVHRNRFPTPAETSKVRMLVPTALLATMDIHSNGPDRNVYTDGTSPVKLWRGTGTGGEITSYNEV